MAYELKALIAKKTILEGLTRKLASAKVVELAGELGLLRLTKALMSAQGPSPFEGLVLPEQAAQAAQESSRHAPIAYVEADYSKGKDHQGSVVWSDGKVSLGPLTNETAWDPRESHDLYERPVNQALRALGVERGSYGDEWDAVALSRHSSNEK